MYHLNTRENDARAPEILEAHHRFDDAFDRSMVLLNDVVQVFVLPDPDRCFAHPTEIRIYDADESNIDSSAVLCVRFLFNQIWHSEIAGIVQGL